jgi:putative dehydrogenase
MGTAMAERLVEAGYSVVGYDLDPARCNALQGAVSVATSAQEVMGRCRTLVIAVYDATQVETTLEVLGSLDENDRPAVICTTTCSPGEIVRIAERAAAVGSAFVEMPVSGTSNEVRAGLATCLIAGDATTISSVRGIVDILCPHSVLAKNIGDASRTKLAINLILQGTRAALAEGIVFAERMGLDGNAFLCTARASAAYSKVMDIKGEKMLTRDYRPQSRISQTLKDAELILKEADRHGLELPITTAQAALLRKAIRLSGADSDSAAVIEAIRQQMDGRDAQ